MENRREEVNRGGRTEVQLGRHRAVELKIREERELEVTGYVYGGAKGGIKKKNGLEDLDAGSISIRDLSWYQTGAISDKKSTWKRL